MVASVCRQQTHLQAALPQRHERQAAAFRELVEGVDVEKAQQAEQTSRPKRAQHHPRIAPTIGNPALMVENAHAGQQKAHRPGHGEEVDRAVDIVRIPVDHAGREGKGALVQVVGQYAGDQQRGRDPQQPPSGGQRGVLAVAQRQCRQEAKHWRENLRDIVEIPKVARDGVFLEKPVFDRAQQQPQHRHRAAEQQIPAHLPVENAPRNRNPPRERQPDIEEVGHQKADGGRERREEDIHLAKQPREDEKTRRRAESAQRFAPCREHSSRLRFIRSEIQKKGLRHCINI